MKNTLSIHGTVSSRRNADLLSDSDTDQGNFLSWHRYYTFAYEQALRKECGYNGTQPVSETVIQPRVTANNKKQYWDWGRWASSPETSPIFDGSDTSMSGQGEKVTHQSNGMKPAGNGGGCIASGPFKNMTVNLG